MALLLSLLLQPIVPGEPVITDPREIDFETWQAIGQLELYGFFWAALMIVAALLFLFGHAFIPSLVLTSHLPNRVSALRPFLYVLAVLIGLAGLYFGILFISMSISVSFEIFPRLWI